MSFHVASSTKDYESCHRLMDEEGINRTWGLTFPTIMALDKKGQLVGFLSTRIEKNMIVAGPLVLKSDQRRMFTALRLAEAYESSMRNLGIKTFVFAGEAGGLLERAIERYYPHVEPYAVQDGIKYWTWRLEGDQQSVSSTSLS